MALALIPGISYDEQGAGHAFVQVIDGVAGKASYERFGSEALQIARSLAGAHGAGSAFATRGFSFAIGANRFSESGIDIDVPGLSAEFSFRQNLPWPTKPWSPGAMGPFSFVPGMQCKHGVVSLHHRVSGSLRRQNDGAVVTLSPQAVGYIEKDWGSSFPLRWTWLQTNHLVGETEPCCLLVSAGRVPWVTGAFDGHIAALLWRGHLEVFATYNGSRLQQTTSGDEVQLSFLKPALTGPAAWLQIDIARPHPASGIDIVAPVAEGGMAGKVNESLTASAQVRFGRGTGLLVETTAHYVGFELGGDQHL